MVPQPIDKEKNACPKAAMTVCPVSLEKSGLNKKSMPSLAPDSNMERMAMAIIISINSGIMILEYFSMPFFTPNTTTKAVKNKKIQVDISGRNTWADDSANICS